jgi:hypothetical protein
MRGLWRYLFILVITVLLWNQAVLRPVKILSVLFHKMGHALAAFFCGFGTDAFKTVFGGLGDITVSTKDWLPSFIITTGGYIASALFFVIIMCLKRTKAKKYVPGCLSIIYLLVTIINPGLRQAVIYAAIFTSIVIVLSMIQRENIEELVLDVIGVSAVAYIIFDTFVATVLLKINQQFSIIRGWNLRVPEDIVRMSDATGIPQVLWAVIWLILSVLVLNMVILKCLKLKRR